MATDPMHFLAHAPRVNRPERATTGNSEETGRQLPRQPRCTQLAAIEPRPVTTTSGERLIYVEERLPAALVGEMFQNRLPCSGTEARGRAASPGELETCICKRTVVVRGNEQAV